MRVLVLGLLVAALSRAHQTQAAEEFAPVNTRPGPSLPAQHMQVVGPSSQFDLPPKFISGAAPIHPITLLRRRKPGYAVINFTIDQTGRTRDVKVGKTNYRYLALLSTAAVEEWRFRPATKNGRPVSCRMRIPFYYRSRR